MAGRLRIGLYVDVGELSRDLRALGDDLDHPIRDVLAQGAKEIADIARGFMRKGQPTWPTSSAARDYPGLIADYYDSRSSTLSASVGSTHPAAPVWEWGGDIHPASGSVLHEVFKRHPQLARGHQVIHIPRTEPVTTAGDQQREELVQNLDDAVSRLIEQYGFA